MKSVTLKFESSEDYYKFIEEVVEPCIDNKQIEVDENNNLLIKKLKKDEINVN